MFIVHRSCVQYVIQIGDFFSFLYKSENFWEASFCQMKSIYSEKYPGILFRMGDFLKGKKMIRTYFLTTPLTSMLVVQTGLWGFFQTRELLFQLALVNNEPPVTFIVVWWRHKKWRYFRNSIFTNIYSEFLFNKKLLDFAQTFRN